MNPEQPKDIILCSWDGVEMVRVAPGGFYVRGVKLEQDEKEARTLFNAITAWLGSPHMIDWWPDYALAHLGQVRDSMPDADVLAVQKFLDAAKGKP